PVSIIDTCNSGKRSNTPVKISCPIVLGTTENTLPRPATALALALAALPPYTPHSPLAPPDALALAAAARCFWRALREIRLMWMQTGMPSSAAACQNGSSASEMESPPDG